MLKRIIGIALSMVLILNVAGCGITEDDFITAVRKYKIFDANNIFNMQTVSDFEKNMESLDENGRKVTTSIIIRWDEEEPSGIFIDRLKQTEDFVYDKKKYYGSLRIDVDILSSTDYSIKESYAYQYLFSLDKDGAVIPEAAASLSNTIGFDYKDITTDPMSIQDSMNVCLLLTKGLKSFYAE